MVLWDWTEMWEILVCSSVGSGCVLPLRVSGGSNLASRSSGVSDGMEMGSARSRPLRTESTYHQMQYLLSYKPPALC
jgi:hypothetical protein